MGIKQVGLTRDGRGYTICKERRVATTTGSNGVCTKVNLLMQQRAARGYRTEHATMLGTMLKAGAQSVPTWHKEHRATMCGTEVRSIKQLLFKLAVYGSPHVDSHEFSDTYTETSSVQQVLRGYKWLLKGSNGRATAQPDHPRGSTRTFQFSPASQAADAARVLSRGVTMHPRGRHLREGMILLTHGGGSPSE